MPEKAAELSARKVASIKAPGMHAVGGTPGLYLQVTAGAGRSWVFRFKLRDKRRDMGLGGVDKYSLSQARERARNLHRQIAEGIDPIDARRAKMTAQAIEAARVITFREAAEQYIAAMRDGWTNRAHARQWPSTLQAHVYPVFGHLPVSAIDTALVMRALEPVWKVTPETASRVRGRIESVLDWATAR